MKQYVLKQEVTKIFRGGSVFPEPYSVTLPAGLRCKPMHPPKPELSKFWLDELPYDLFPKCSAIRHDAYYYGITIEPEEVIETK